MPTKILTSLHGRKVGLDANGRLVVAGKVVPAVLDGGAEFTTMRDPVAVNATATLTTAQLLAGVITSTTASAVVGTLPTGTLIDAGVTDPPMRVDDAFDWTVINTGGTNTFTVAANTGHTLVGSGVVPANTACLFRTRKTAANTFVTYRMS